MNAPNRRALARLEQVRAAERQRRLRLLLDIDPQVQEAARRARERPAFGAAAQLRTLDCRDVLPLSGQPVDNRENEKALR